MGSFVTGGTGFIGRFLVQNLLDREHTVYLLVRPQSTQKFEDLKENWWDGDTDNITPVYGDITNSGVLESEDEFEKIDENIDNLFHLAAIYDLSVDPKTARDINLRGTQNIIDLHENHFPDATFHHVSSIAVAGDFDGIFREDYFDEGQSFENPYFETKFKSEQMVREELSPPVKIYRPGIVVGSSETGEIDKINGPYYFFKIIQQLRDFLPRWVPLIGLEGDDLQLAPVDYVTDAIDQIAFESDTNEQVFHLVDPDPKSLGDTMNEFFRAAKGPELSMRIDSRLFNFIPDVIQNQVFSLPMVQELKESFAESIGIPSEILAHMNFSATLDDRNTQKALDDSSVECPPLEDYAWKLWDYWERELDPDLHKAQNFIDAVEDKIVIVTGASSGIGKRVALRTGKAGADVILMARSVEDLREVKTEIDSEGDGNGYVYPLDLTDYEGIDETLSEIVDEHGAVDILINNAGHSIRRGVFKSLDRFHDFTRTMDLNYFGALRMILRTLPGMVDQEDGHIINISSIGVLSNPPRFSAYVASKAALGAFSRCIAPEVKDSGVDITTIYMPLVRTPMIEPTKIYQFFPALTPEDAADLVAEAIVERPKRVATRVGTFAEVSYSIMPKLYDAVLNMSYRLFPSNEPSDEDEEPEEELSPEGVAFAHLMKGIHW